MWKVQLFKLNYDEKESKVVKDVVDSGWITMGEKTREFENKFSKEVIDNTGCIAVSSCTAALHIALLSLNLKKDDEVIIPALTFIADMNVVKIVGAKPVLADCESYDNWNVSAKTIKKVITPKTKAVIIVHFAGYPCDMDEIVKLCKDRNITLIEDCAHAPNAKYKEKAVGTFGDFGCFSFFTNKNLSVGEGGMICSKNEEKLKTVKLIRSHGMDALTLDRHKGRAITYDVIRLGLNYRIDEMRSALGLVQLDKLKKANLNRKKLTERYIKNLKDCKNITLPFLNLKNIESVYHIFPILLDKSLDRVEVINKLKKNGIQSSIHYPALKDFTAFKNIGLNEAPIAEDISKREITLPLYPTMIFEEVDLVCENLRKVLGGTN
jgi:dTDP-4-amino-4,6-dideoxygalactose transaminase